MKIRRHTLTIETDGSGAGSGVILDENDDPILFTGVVRAVSYVKDQTNPYDSGAIMSIFGTPDAGTPFWSVIANVLGGSNNIVVYPRVYVSLPNATPALNYGSEFKTVPEFFAGVPIAGVVANGGANKVGTFHIYLDHYLRFDNR